MSETTRVQRWREAKRQHGLKAVTIWLSEAEDMRLKDLALQARCSPSALVQQALHQFTPTRPQENSDPQDTSLDTPAYPRRTGRHAGDTAPCDTRCYCHAYGNASRDSSSIAG